MSNTNLDQHMALEKASNKVEDNQYLKYQCMFNMVVALEFTVSYTCMKYVLKFDCFLFRVNQSLMRPSTFGVYT